MVNIKSSSIIDFLLAGYIACVVVGETLVTYSGRPDAKFPTNFTDSPSIESFIIFSAVILGVFILLTIIRRIVVNRTKETQGSYVKQKVCGDGERRIIIRRRRLFLLFSWIFIILLWMIPYANYWPGTSMNDQIWILHNPIQNSDSHPILYNLLLSNLLEIGLTWFDSGSVGIAIYVVIQMLICATIIVYCCRWLLLRDTPKAIVAGIVVLFACEPLIASYSYTIWKDTYFSYFLLLWIPLLYESAVDANAFWKKNTSYIALALLIVIISISRNNGIYISAVLCIVIIALYYRYLFKIKVFISIFIALLLSLCPNYLVKSEFDIQPLFREKVAIPLQQLSAVQCMRGGYSDWAKEYIETLLPSCYIEKSYAPTTVDTVKFSDWFNNEYLESTQDTFMQAYVSTGIRNPDTYLRAYLSETYGNWSVLAKGSSQDYALELSDNIEVDYLNSFMEKIKLKNVSQYPECISEWFERYYSKAFLFPGPGFCFMVLVLCGWVVSVRHGSNKMLSICLPCIALWATLMIATPLSLALRYVFPMVVAIPFLFGAIFTATSRHQEDRA